MYFDSLKPSSNSTDVPLGGQILLTNALYMLIQRPA